MATVITFRCRCGRGYLVYLSPKTLAELVPVPDPSQTDSIQDDAHGAITGVNALRSFADQHRLTFVDGTLIDVVDCECGEITDVAAALRPRTR